MTDTSSAPAERVVTAATIEARQLDHPRVGTEHLLLGLLSDEGTAAADVLQAAGATLSAARHMVGELVTADAPSLDDEVLPLTARAQRAVERAARFSRNDRSPEVTAAHILLGVLDVEGLACQVLRGLSVDIVQLRNALVTTRAEVAPAPVEDPAASTPVRPACPHCRAHLAESLTQTMIAARHDGRPSTNVSVVYCGACGATLGVLPVSSAAPRAVARK